MWPRGRFSPARLGGIVPTSGLRTGSFAENQDVCRPGIRSALLGRDRRLIVPEVRSLSREGRAVPDAEIPATDLHKRTPSSLSLRALDALNVFLADVRDGMGPFIGTFL